MAHKPVLLVLLLVAALLAGCSAKPSAESSTSSSSSSSATPSASISSSDSGSATSSSHSSSAGTSSTGPHAQHPPTAELTASTSGGTAPLNVTFTAKGSDPDGDSLTWTLDANGDGKADGNGTALPGSVTFSYTAAGNFTAKLTVSDGTASTTANVTIAVAKAGGPVTTYSCKTTAGDTVPSAVPVVGGAGLSGSTPAGNVGGCNLTASSVGGVATAVSGCRITYDSNADNQSDGDVVIGTAITEGWSLTAFCEAGTQDVDSSASIQSPS